MNWIGKALFVIWAGIIILGSVANPSSLSEWSFVHPVFMHAIAYAILAIIFLSCFKPVNIYLEDFCRVFVCCSALGYILEEIQRKIPYRQYDLNDVLLNSAGITIGFCLWRLYKNAQEEIEAEFL